MSSDEEEASHVIVVEGIHRLGESLFLEVGMSTTGSLPLTKRGVLRRPSSLSFRSFRACPEGSRTSPQDERLLLNHVNTPGFLAPGGEEFNLGPETRLDRSELLCNKVLLKYKGDRESF